MSDTISNNKFLRYFYPILFLIPLNFFIISGGIGSGIQWFFFKYQTTFMGDIIIPIASSLDYVLSGIITGKSALFELSPLVSFAVLFLAFVYAMSNRTKISGVLTILSGIISLSASVILYGITLQGPAGICIPFGSVILLLYGMILYISVPDPVSENLLVKFHNTLKKNNSVLDPAGENLSVKYDDQFTLKNLLSIVIIVKFTIFLVIILSYFILPYNIDYYSENFVYPPDDPVTIFSIFKTWDGHNYLYLAENGYPKEVTNRTAFYPLYPFLIKIVGIILLGNTLLAGLIISNICSILAMVYFYLLVKKLYNNKIAFTASLLMISFITFFYTSLVYSEGLFLFLVSAFFYYFYEKKIYACLLLSILIPLTRPTGILVILPLVAYLVSNAWINKKIENKKNYLLLLGFITGFLLYLGMMNYYTGSPFSGFAAQNLFISKNSLGNLFNPLWFQRNFISIDYTFNGFTTSILNRIVFGFYLILLYFIYKYLDITLFVYSLALGLIPALTGDFMSYIRYILVVFPIFIVLSIKFQKNPYLIIIPSAMLQILFLIAHTLNYWVA